MWRIYVLSSVHSILSLIHIYSANGGYSYEAEETIPLNGEKEIAGTCLLYTSRCVYEPGTIKGDFATTFVLREDFFRSMNGVEDKMRTIDGKLDKLLLKQ